MMLVKPTERIEQVSTRKMHARSVSSISSAPMVASMLRDLRISLTVLMRLDASSRSTETKGMTATSPVGTDHGPQSAQATARRQRKLLLPARLPARMTQRRRPLRRKRENSSSHQRGVLWNPLDTSCASIWAKAFRKLSMSNFLTGFT